jgi:hypothetical protein
VLKIRYLILLALIAFIFVNCNKAKSKDRKIARVYDEYLYESDIKSIIPSGMKEKDSIQFVSNYIDNWIRQQLLYKQADKNLSKELKNFDRQVNEYKNTLVIYAYEKELIRQFLDTIVTEKEIAAYYDSNSDNFELKDNIVKVVYVKLPKNSSVISKVRMLYKSDNQNEKLELANLCQKYAVNSSLEDDSWFYFSDLLKEIPITTYNQEEYLNNHKYIEMQDSLYNYFLRIIGFKIKESTSPLSMERENIRSIIMNKRKLQLVEKMHKDIYIKAQTNNDFEKY